MAPRKRKAENGDGEPPAATRRSTRLANSNSAAPPPELPAKKKGKANGKKETAKPKKKPEAVTETVEEKGEVEEEIAGGGTAKTIVVEHCKQCTQFKKRAILVKEGLEAAVPGVFVLLNPDKPRRGCFEIREKDGEIFISLLDMKRPFQPMKDLDMDEVISDIVEKIKT